MASAYDSEASEVMGLRMTTDATDRAWRGFGMTVLLAAFLMGIVFAVYMGWDAYNQPIIRYKGGEFPSERISVTGSVARGFAFGGILGGLAGFLPGALIAASRLSKHPPTNT
jgi:hypothetical protein